MEKKTNKEKKRNFQIFEKIMKSVSFWWRYFPSVKKYTVIK